MSQHQIQWNARDDFKVANAIASELFYSISIIYDHLYVSCMSKIDAFEAQNTFAPLNRLENELRIVVRKSPEILRF